MLASVADIYDVAVIGGGMAGTATAIALRKGGFSVSIVERANYKRRRPAEVLPPEVKECLFNLGLWDDFLGLRCRAAIARQSSWGSSSLDSFDYIFNPYGNGWVIERPAADHLFACCALREGVSGFWNARVISYRHEKNGPWHLTLEHDGIVRTIRARFIVVATGRGSSVLRNPRGRRLAYDRLVAVFASVARPPDWPVSDFQPLIEATPDGWWYSILLPDGHVNMAMMTDFDIACNMTRRSGTRQLALTAALKRAPHTSARLSGQLCFLAPPQTAAANTYFNEGSAQDCMIAVGDASYAIDPLAGQGSYMSLAGALRAAETVLAHDRLGAAALETYGTDERRRFARLLSERIAYYRLENRWPHSPFWSRRRSIEVGMIY